MESSRSVVTGAVFLMCSVQYFAAELIAAAAWSDPPYDWAHNYISDLGSVECGPGICSPNHAVIGASLVVHAIIVLVATALLIGLLARRWVRAAMCGLVLVHVAGCLVVVYAPLRPYTDSNELHYLGAALGISGGIAVIGLAGVMSLRAPGRALFGVCSVLTSAFALAGLVLVRWNATADAGLAAGLLERMAVDPIVLWSAGTGVVLVVAAARRAAVGRSAAHAGGAEATPVQER